MLVLLSPAKTLNWSASRSTRFTLPHFLHRAEELAAQMRNKSKADLKRIMSISDSLAELNHTRFQAFQTGVDASSVAPGDEFKQALLAFDGPVCKGVDPDSLSDDDLEFAQEHVRLLSGLYGVLRPLDLMQPYRLEMGSKGLALATSSGEFNTLYDYWGEAIADHLHSDLDAAKAPGSDRWIVNLASQEYAKAACLPQLQQRGVKVLQCVFKDEGRVMSLFAKRARGLMTRYIIDNRVTNDINALKRFDLEGYQFSERESSECEFVFNRPASRRPPPMRAGARGVSNTATTTAAATAAAAGAATTAGGAGKKAASGRRSKKAADEDNEDGEEEKTADDAGSKRKRSRK